MYEFRLFLSRFTMFQYTNEKTKQTEKKQKEWLQKYSWTKIGGYNSFKILHIILSRYSTLFEQ